MKLKIFFLSVTCLLICSSCYKELDMEKYRPIPKYVLNCGVAPDSVITASVTRTWFYTDHNLNLTLKDVRVDLYVNDEYKEQMWWEDNKEKGQDYNSDGIYVSSVVPEAGDRIKIVATGEYGTIMAEEIIPIPAGLEKVDVLYQDEDEYYGQITYKITLKDPGETTDYYLINLIAEETSYGYGYYPFDWDKEPIFRSNTSMLDNIFGDNWINGFGGVVFSDELINGKEYALTVTERWSKYIYVSPENEEIPSIRRSVYIYKISETYYQYLSILQSYWSSIQYDLADLGLAEPVRIPSNVQGGTGIMGGYNPGKGISMDLMELVPYEIVEWNY